VSRVLVCESCDQPATRKDACGTALCGRCWSADEAVPPQLTTAFCCRDCGEMMDEPHRCAACGVERDDPDYDAPRPLTALENWQRNDEHNVP
jgi:hypothetical protein